MSNVALAVTNSDNGRRERFHPDLVYQVEPHRRGAVITVRGVEKIHVAESFHKVNPNRGEEHHRRAASSPYRIP